MERLAAKIVRDFSYIRRRFPLRCPLCAGSNVSTRISSLANREREERVQDDRRSGNPHARVTAL